MEDLLSMSLDDLLHVDISDMMGGETYTDSFFQHWSAIKPYRSQLSTPIKKARKKKTKPLKLLVYQQDTGQQALSYAVDLLEAGLQNFFILVITPFEQGAFTPQDLSYTADSFNRLPIPLQTILRKHFHQNEDTDLWQLHDPDFFAARIKFIPHDSLVDLPSDLTREYTPPYDMISILGGIAGSEKETRVKAKGHWVKVLKDGGTLILHDGKYSAFSGWLDHAWCYDNLLTVNQWINVKDDRKRSKMSKHKKLYSQKATQEHYELLNRAYLMMGKQKEAQRLTEDYIVTQPLSFIPQVRLLGHLRLTNDKERYRQVIDTLVRTNSDHMTVLGRMTFLQQDVDFIKQLKRSYLEAWNVFKESPQDIDRVIHTFAFKTAQSESFDILRDILKTRLLLFIQGVYARQDNDAELDALSKTITDTIHRIHEHKPDYLIAGKLLVAATKTHTEYYFSHEAYDKTLALANVGIQSIQEQYNNPNYFYTREGLGDLHLLLARVYQRKQAWSLVAKHAEQAQIFFDQAMQLIEEKRPETQWRLIGNLGHSHMLQGQAHLGNKATTKANVSFLEAFATFERALEINPQAADPIAQLRNELVQITHEHQDLSDLAPLEGWWLEN
ncbi:hypothetical protein ACFL6U_07920 [Planctomycetota bacterium]